MESSGKQIKIYSWALSADVICVILFVLWCTFTYKALIQGNYWGFAVHSVSEINNDSYSYTSSRESQDSDQESNCSDKISICSNIKADKSYLNLYSQFEKFSLGSFSGNFLQNYKKPNNKIDYDKILNKD